MRFAEFGPYSLFFLGSTLVLLDDVSRGEFDREPYWNEAVEAAHRDGWEPFSDTPDFEYGNLALYFLGRT